MLGLAGLAFAACSNEDEMGSGAKEKDKVVISLSLGKADTKSLGVTAGEKYNKINNLEIAFYNGQDIYVPIDKTIETELDTKIKTAVAELNSGHTATLEITGVPAPASKLYIVANKNGLNIDYSSKGAVSSTPLPLATQNTPATGENAFTVFSGENSTLTGLGSIGEADDTGKASVTVELKPVPSRIEVTNIVAIPEDAGSQEVEVKSFKVEGIFINEFYPYGYLDEIHESTDYVIDNASDKDKYTAAAYEKTSHKNQANQTVDGNFSFMCDELDNVGGDARFTYESSTVPSTDGYVYKATPAKTTGDVAQNWGYQVLAGDPPHIVVKLKVTLVDGTGAVVATDKEQYLTIDKYTKDGTSLGRVDRGHVYVVGDIKFQSGDLTDVPYQGTKTVSATVKVLSWVPVTVIPGFN